MRKLNLKFNLLAFIFISCFLLISCNSNNKQLSVALEQAGQNRNELEKVIAHYQQHPKDSLKLKAAYYLIENMPGHFSYDTTHLYKYRPVIKEIRRLRVKNLSIPSIKEQVNPMMDSLVIRYPLSYVYSINKDDITTIKSACLIRTIDQAFEAYRNNAFKNQILFNDFLEYVLPYRIANGYALEEWRTYFTANNSLSNTKDFTTLQQLSDTLLYSFKDVKLAWKLAEQFPYLKLNDYLQSGMAQCDAGSTVCCSALLECL